MTAVTVVTIKMTVQKTPSQSSLTVTKPRISKSVFYENQGDFDNASPVFVKAPQRFCKPDLPEYETVLKQSIPINTERLPQKPQIASQSPRHFADERMKVS